MTGPSNDETTDVAAAAPALRIVRGDPAPEELAALIAVVAARGSDVEPERPAAPSSWAAYWRGVRTTPRPAPGGWRDSGSPM